MSRSLYEVPVVRVSDRAVLQALQVVYGVVLGIGGSIVCCLVRMGHVVAVGIATTVRNGGYKTYCT